MTLSAAVLASCMSSLLGSLCFVFVHGEVKGQAKAKGKGKGRANGNEPVQCIRKVRLWVHLQGEEDQVCETLTEVSSIVKVSLAIFWKVSKHCDIFFASINDRHLYYQNQQDQRSQKFKHDFLLGTST